MWLQADKSGNYRGECAEFCGVQHAHMDFVVVAQSYSDFSSWQNQQLAPPVKPAANSVEAAGQQVFLQAGCVGCHVIDSVTPGGVRIGPNLTHFGSRLLIAGGVLDRTPQNLANWVLNAQEIKSGGDMPSSRETDT